MLYDNTLDGVYALIRHVATLVGPNPDNILNALRRARGGPERRISGVNRPRNGDDAVAKFRKMSEPRRQHAIFLALSSALETAENPLGAEREPSVTAPAPSSALARIEMVTPRSQPIELVIEEGTALKATVRSIATFLGRQPNDFSTYLRTRGYVLRDAFLMNNRGEVRPTPCVAADQVSVIIATASTRGMTPERRNLVFGVQQDLPDLIRRYDQRTGSLPDNALLGQALDALKEVVGMVRDIQQEMRELRTQNSPRLLPAPLSSMREVPQLSALPMRRCATFVERGRKTLTQIVQHVRSFKPDATRDEVERFLQANPFLSEAPWAEFNSKDGPVWDEEAVECIRHALTDEHIASMGREVELVPGKPVDPLVS